MLDWKTILDTSKEKQDESGAKGQKISLEFEIFCYALIMNSLSHVLHVLQQKQGHCIMSVAI